MRHATLAAGMLLAAATCPAGASAVEESQPRYTFESGVAGWKPQAYADARACVDVQRDGGHARSGRAAMAMSMRLDGSVPSRSKGEAFVDLRGDAAAGADLERRTVTAWIWAPRGARGEPANPNGVQLFVKDGESRSLYGTWTPIADEEWTKVVLAVARTAPREGFLDAGFDPSRVVLLGVKVGTSTGSAARYDGPIYVDDVAW